MRKTVVSAVCAVFILALTFTACDSFFASGWGDPRDYRAENIDLTVRNLDDWFERTVGNPPLASAVSEAVLLKLASLPPDHPDRAIFQGFGIRMAVGSSNMGAIILTNALGVLADLADLENLSDEDLQDLLKDILGSIQSDFRNAGGAAAARDIAAIAGPGIQDPTGTPTFPPGSFAHDASSSDVGQAIMVLTLALVDDSDYVDDFADWEDFDLEALGLELYGTEVRVVGTNPSPEAVVLAAYLNLVYSEDRFNDNFLTGAIRDAFFGAAEGYEGGL